MIKQMSMFTHHQSRPIIIAAIGGLLLSLMRVPMGWMLGSIMIVAIMNIHNEAEGDHNKTPLHPIWKQIAQVILAVQAGVHLNPSILNSLITGWPVILLMLFLILTLSCVIGIIFSKVTNTSIRTGVLAACPGGVSVIPIVSEEMKANPVIVSTIHVLRVIFVACSIPTLSSLISSKQPGHFAIRHLNIEPLYENNVFESLEFFHSQPLLWTFILCGSAYLGFSFFRLLRFPSAILLGSLIGVGLIQYFASSYLGLSLHAWLPHWLGIVMQIFIGANLGSTFKRNMLIGWKKILSAGLFVILILTLVSSGCALVIHHILSIPLDTAILSFAPGGLAVMTATAITLKADISFVIAVQTIRLLLILIILSAVSKWLQHSSRTRR